MKRAYIFAAIVATLCASCAQKETNTTEKRIEELISQMTIEEKLGQMNLIPNPYLSTGASADTNHNNNIDELIKDGKVGNFLNVFGAKETGRLQKIAAEESRLGIPLLFGFDVIHGYKTTFPIPLAEASSFDMSVIEKSSRYSSMESAANGINWTYAPMVDISRDARWGRVMEGAGEDVYLTSKVAEARVKGIQGSSLSDETTIASCIKHFVGYGAAIAGRDYAATEISDRALYETYLPPFKAAADAGAASFMSAFNTVNGEPTSASRWLLNDILREEWGYDGLVVSDWKSINETIAHGTSADNKEAAYNGIYAGVDMDMCGNLYIENGAELIAEKRIDEKRLDEMVRHVLKVKFDLGLFDDPYKYSNTQREKEITLSDEIMDATHDVAKQSIVLLKNETQTLPITKKIKRIAVIGPLADDKDSPLGNWRAKVKTNSAVSLLEGIKSVADSDVEVVYAKGVNIVQNEEMGFHAELKDEKKDRSGFAEALRAARNADIIVMAVGETAFMTGECRSYADISLKGLQEELITEVAKIGKPMVMTLFTGRPLVLTNVVDHFDAIVNCWFLGSQSGHAIADVLFGKYNPSAKLPISFPYHVGQLPIYYSSLNTGRPYNANPQGFSSKYRDIPNTPLYAFGHGLSYTTFDYSNIKLSSPEISMNDELHITFDVKNSGDFDGAEVAQLYVRDMLGNQISRPMIELKRFEKKNIARGETAKFEFVITPKDLSFYRIDKTLAPEAGEFTIFVGGASDDLPLSATFTLTE